MAAAAALFIYLLCLLRLLSFSAATCNLPPLPCHSPTTIYLPHRLWKCDVCWPFVGWLHARLDTDTQIRIQLLCFGLIFLSYYFFFFLSPLLFTFYVLEHDGFFLLFFWPNVCYNYSKKGQIIFMSQPEVRVLTWPITNLALGMPNKSEQQIVGSQRLIRVQVLY